MGRNTRPAAAAAAILALLPEGASADPDHVLCLAEFDPGPTPSCFGLPCGTLHTTLEDALVEAAALPDLGGERPEVHVCLGVGALDGDALWTGSLSIDNRGGTYGEPFVMHLGRPMCPSPESSASTPLIEIASDGQVQSSGPMVDFDTCASGPRPAVSVWGGGDFTFNGSAVHGWAGYAFANGVAGPAGELHIREGSIAGGDGAAIRSSGSTAIFEVELIGNRTAGEPALVRLDRTGFRLAIYDSAFYGNIVDPQADALVSGAPVAVWNTSFVANALTGEAPIVLTGAQWPDHATTAPWGSGGLQHTTFSRNRWLSDAPADPDLRASTYVPAGDSTCSGVPAVPYEERLHPFDGATSGVPAAVVRVAGQNSDVASPGEGLLFFVGRSQFIENLGATPIYVDSPGRDVQILLAHNTIADPAVAAVLRVAGEENTDVTLVRNLLVDGGDPSVVELLTAVRSIVSTANAAPVAGAWAPRGGSYEFELIGPEVVFESAAFLEPETLRSASACDRYAAVCPDVDPQDCITPDGSYYVCAPDRAAEFIPTPAFSSRLSVPWPWDTDWFGQPSDQTPGASGWRCGGLHGTYDFWGEAGDSDGFPDVVDCFNEDPERYPSLPEHDGYTSPYCDAGDVDCYICPEGTLPPPQDDDDSGEPTPGTESGRGLVVGEGCTRGGCGVAYFCHSDAPAGAAFFSILLLGPRRRR